MAYWIGVLQASPPYDAPGLPPLMLQGCPQSSAWTSCLLQTRHVCAEESSCLLGWLLRVACVQDQIPHVVEKAATSEGATAEAQRRAAAFGRALDLHLTRLRCAAACLPACLAAWLPLLGPILLDLGTNRL